MEAPLATYAVVLEVVPMKAGRAYDRLPLHCTLMPRFLSSLAAAELSRQLSPLFTEVPPIQLQPGERLAFGPKRVMVNKLQPSPELIALHQKLFRLLNTLGVRYTESEWVDEGYIPHVTDQGEARLTTEQVVISRAAYLIEIDFPLHGSKKHIRDKYILEGR